eukprot:TRINITY_DN1092_c0_g1_i2.p1 TRINITY_DN1092_c0_g1~~TRINITY_DN1092_c0_g1_i2.p1  ORF type:complete len:131 (-),score=5.58 TRINITY_DN1092_c0_g1_i2:67-459(-)
MSDFEKGICGCFEDGSICFLTCCCPCVQLGKNMELVDQSFVLWMMLPILFYIVTICSGFFVPLSICIPCICCIARGQIRNKYGIDGNPFFDCCWVFGCNVIPSWLVAIWPCGINLTICQEGNETKFRSSG